MDFHKRGDYGTILDVPTSATQIKARRALLEATEEVTDACN